MSIHVLSLGGGVQSSTVALMAAHGEIRPMPVAAVFADTGDEPQSVYDWLEYLKPHLPFPVVTACYRSPEGNAQTLAKHIAEAKANGTRMSTPPLFTAPEDGREQEGILMRQCTRDFKVYVIQRAVRELMRQHGAKHAVQWIGISLDEIQRMKPSRVKYATHRHPLIEMEKTRHDCLRWMELMGYPKPPRSACVYCPHHSNQEWRRLRDEEPEAWQRAVEFDRMIRTGVRAVRAKCYVHRDCVPLDKVDLSTDSERGQGLLWGNECEGMCGV